MMAQSSSSGTRSREVNDNSTASASILTSPAHPPSSSATAKQILQTRVEFARSISAVIDNRTVSIEHRDDDEGVEDEEEEHESRDNVSDLRSNVYDGNSSSRTTAKGLRSRRDRQRDKGHAAAVSAGSQKQEHDDKNEDYEFNEKERRHDGRVIQKILERASKNKPKDSDWRQQRLQAWEPILTASTVLPSFLVIGLIFIPVGIFLLHSSRSVREFTHDYTDCERIPDARNPQQSICIIHFTLDRDFVPDVYLYYVLTKYYQSHRHYASSRDDAGQLAGYADEDHDPDHACEPFRYDPETEKPIAPCGIVANSMFNDTFHLDVRDHDDDESAVFTLNHDIEYIKINRTNIAWVTDKAYKYRNPRNMSHFDHDWAKPPNWGTAANQLDKEDPANNGFMNEHFLVWMRIGAFPYVRKFYGRVFCDRSYVNRSMARDPGERHFYEEGLPAGNYTMTIAYNYDVSEFGSRKLFILTTTSWFGGRSDFLGITYIIVGVLIIMLTAFLFFVHRTYGKRYPCPESEGERTQRLAPVKRKVQL